MKKTMKRSITAMLTMAIMLFLVACGNPVGEVTPEEASMRIISVAPSVTEMIYALGKGDQLVGM